MKRRIPVTDPLQGKVAEILKASERAAGLTRQLLAFSRKQVLQPRVLDLNLVVADMDKMLRRLIGENIELNLSLAEPLGSVRADPGQIEQVLMNLVVNARDAMRSGSSPAERRRCTSTTHTSHAPGGHRAPMWYGVAIRRGKDGETGSRDLRAVLHTKAVGGVGSVCPGVRDRLQSGGLSKCRARKDGARLQGLHSVHRGHGEAREEARRRTPCPRELRDRPPGRGRAACAT